jgi:hypothetical protein
MNKTVLPALCLCAAISCAACSAPQEPDQEEQGRIEQLTDDVARDATNAIKRPLDKARGVGELSRKHTEDMEQD